MVSTVLDIIKDAMLNIGVIAIEETPSNAEAEQGLRALNLLIDTWQNESLMIYDIQPRVFPFVAGQQSYTIGTGGNFNTPRPIRIVDAYARDAQGNDYKLEIISQENYADIITKYTSSPLPTCVYYDSNYPLSSLFYWPVPSSAAYSAVLWCWVPITSFTSVATNISLPPGYERVMSYNLAMELAPKFGVAVSADIARLAMSSKAQIQTTNYVVNEMGFDADLVGTKGRTFNWLTGNIN